MGFLHSRLRVFAVRGGRAAGGCGARRCGWFLRVAGGCAAGLRGCRFFCACGVARAPERAKSGRVHAAIFGVYFAHEGGARRGFGGLLT